MEKTKTLALNKCVLWIYPNRPWCPHRQPIHLRLGTPPAFPGVSPSSCRGIPPSSWPWLFHRAAAAFPCYRPWTLFSSWPGNPSMPARPPVPFCSLRCSESLNRALGLCRGEPSTLCTAVASRCWCNPLAPPWLSERMLKSQLGCRRETVGKMRNRQTCCCLPASFSSSSFYLFSYAPRGGSWWFWAACGARARRSRSSWSRQSSCGFCAEADQERRGRRCPLCCPCCWEDSSYSWAAPPGTAEVLQKLLLKYTKHTNCAVNAAFRPFNTWIFMLLLI